MIPFKEDMMTFHSSVRPLRSIAEELRDALKGSDQFAIRYQPIIESKSGKVGFAEAFVRWTSPILGEVLPGRFIHVAEKNGLIRAVTRMVLQNVCADVATCPELVVSVNVSKVDIMAPEFADEVSDILGKYGVSPNQIILECTENITSDEQFEAAPTLQRLKARGHAVATYDIDNSLTSFGFLEMAGYSLLKVDKVLLEEALQNAKSRENLQAALDGNRQNGFKSLAFGIETQEQSELVAAMGFDLQQGYYHSHSLSLDELMEFRERRSIRCVVQNV